MLQLRTGPTVGLAFSTELGSYSNISVHLLLVSLLPRQVNQHREEHRGPMLLSPHIEALTGGDGGI